MPNPFTQSPGVEQGDVGPRYTRKRLQDEYYLARFCKAGDRLRIRAQMATGVHAAVGDVTVVVGGRMHGMDGQLVTFGDTYVYTADGVQTTQYFVVPEGYVVGLIVESTTAGLQIGDVNVTVDIVEGEGAAAHAVDLIANGWVSDLLMLALNFVPQAV